MPTSASDKKIFEKYWATKLVTLNISIDTMNKNRALVKTHGKIPALRARTYVRNIMLLNMEFAKASKLKKLGERDEQHIMKGMSVAERTDHIHDFIGKGQAFSLYRVGKNNYFTNPGNSPETMLMMADVYIKNKKNLQKIFEYKWPDDPDAVRRVRELSDTETLPSGQPTLHHVSLSAEWVDFKRNEEFRVRKMFFKNPQRMLQLIKKLDQHFREYGEEVKRGKVGPREFEQHMQAIQQEHDDILKGKVPASVLAQQSRGAPTAPDVRGWFEMKKHVVDLFRKFHGTKNIPQKRVGALKSQLEDYMAQLPPFPMSRFAVKKK